jgi:hypothetical protein
MLLTDALSSFPWWAYVLLILGVACARAASFRYQKGLSKYPGPFLASFTNFWRLWQWYRHTDRCTFPDVAHYGKIIRIGPDTLLFNDPEAIKDIYQTHFDKVSGDGHPEVRDIAD